MTDVVGSPGWSITPVQAEVAYHNCQLCGRRGPTPTADDNVAMWAGRMERWPDAVSMTLVHWFDPLPGKEWTQEYICEDRDACYRVVTDFGETWNIRDGRPRRPARSAMADQVIAALGLPTDEEQAEVADGGSQPGIGGHGETTNEPMVAGTVQGVQGPADTLNLSTSDESDGSDSLHHPASAADDDDAGELDWGLGA